MSHRGTSHEKRGFGFKLSVSVTSHAYLLEIEGLFTQGSRPDRTVGKSVGGMLETHSSDRSIGIRYHIFDTRPDTEFKGLTRDWRDAPGRVASLEDGTSHRRAWIVRCRRSKQSEARQLETVH